MKTRFASNSIEGKLYRLALQIFLPMVLLAGLILMMLIVYNVQYASITENITTASGFNQDFKADVDLKMYYYVIGSSGEIPAEEIRTARSLAQTLLDNTTNPDSRKAVGSVLGLCDSLWSSVGRIQNTEGYDKRIEQLETNIYVITQLIEEYLYTYLYHEAGQLARLQHMLNVTLVGEIAAVLLILAAVVYVAVRQAIATSSSRRYTPKSPPRERLGLRRWAMLVTLLALSSCFCFLRRALSGLVLTDAVLLMCPPFSARTGSIYCTGS